MFLLPPKARLTGCGNYLPSTDQCHASLGRLWKPNLAAFLASHWKPGLSLDLIDRPLWVKSIASPFHGSNCRDARLAACTEKTGFWH